MKKFLALLLTLTLCLSMTATAFAAGTDSSGSLTGDGSVEETIYSVVVPTTLAFVIDPYMIKAGGNQLFSSEFGFINKGAFDVKVGMALQLQTGTDVTLSDTAILASIDTETTKKAYIGAAVSTTASAGTTGNAVKFDSTTVTESTFATSGTTLVAFDATDKKASFGFALTKATSSAGTDVMDTLESKGVASFILYGELATYAGWKTGDLKMTGKYVLSPIRTGGTAGDAIAGSHNAIEYTPVPVFGFQDAAMTWSRTKGGTINYDPGTKTLSKIYLTDYPTFEFVDPTDYEIANKIVTFKYGSATMFGKSTNLSTFTIGWKGKITAEFDDGYKSEMQVTIAS